MASLPINEDGTGKVEARILVTNFPSGTTKEELYEYFETTYGEVQHTHMEPDSATITFFDIKVAETVASKKSIKFKGKSIDVYKDNSNCEATENKVAESVSTCYPHPCEPDQKTIVVYGVSESFHELDVRLYFENTIRSRGGPIEDFDCGLKRAIKITFCSSDDAKNVVEKKDHMINKCPLTVTMYVPPRMEEKLVLISDIEHHITHETLRNYLEPKASVKVENIKNVKPGHFFVQFTDKIDFQKLKTACESSKLRNSYPKVRQVPVSNKIIVSNISPDLHQNHLEFYFGTPLEPENLVSSRMITGPPRKCIITFKDAWVASEMSMLKNDKFCITLYCDYVDDETCIDINLPSQFWIRFLKDHKKILEDKLKTFGNPVWSDSNESLLKIMCNHDCEEGEIKKRVEDTVCEEILSIPSANYEEVKDTMKSIEEPICVYYDDKNFKAHILSFNKSEAANCHKRMESVVKSCQKTQASNLQVHIEQQLKAGDVAEKISEKLPPESDQTTIVVHGASEKLSEKDVNIYFENKKKSSGGQNKIIDFDIKNGIIIKFDSSKVTRNVVEKKDHMINKCPLTVTMYVPPRMEEKQVLISEIYHRITDDLLKNFLDVKIGLDVEEVRNPKPGNWLICFADKIDFEKFKNQIESDSTGYLSETIPKVRRVPVTKKIIVSDIPTEFDKIKLELYFGNPMEPDQLVSCKMLSGRRCIITFKDASVAFKMSQLKHENFVIKLFNEYFDVIETFIDLNLPSRFWIIFLLYHKISFESKLQCYGKPIWSDSSEKLLRIMCNHDIIEEDIKIKVEDTVHEDLLTIPPVIYGKIKGIIEKDEKNVCVYFDDENSNAYIFSFNKSEVTDYLKKMENIIDSDLVVEKKIELKAYEMELLFLSPFPLNISKEYPKLNVRKEDGMLVLKGNPIDIRAVSNKLCKFCNNISSSCIKLPENAHQILSKIPVKEYIQKKLRNKNCICAWETHDEQVRIYVLLKNNLKMATNILEKSITVLSIDLTEIFKKTPPNWHEFLNHMSHKYADKSYIESNEEKLSIVTIDEVYPKIRSDLESFLDRNGLR